MPITFGDLQSKAKFRDPEPGPRDVKTDMRNPFTLDGELVVVGGRGGRDLVVSIHISAKSRDAAQAEVDGWIAKEGKRETLTLKYEGTGGAATYPEAFLRQVIPDKVRHVAYDSEIDGPAWQADPTLVFRQLSIADKSPTAGRGFGA